MIQPLPRWALALMVALGVIVAAAIVWWSTERGEGAVEPADWRVASPTELEPTVRSVPILVHEVGCASGALADGRIDVDVSYDENAVTFSVGVRPRGGDQACPGNPDTPFVVELTEPLGERPILGERWPADRDPPPTSYSVVPASPTLDEVAGAIGCNVLDRDGTIQEDFTFLAETGDCSIGSRFVARIHTYPLDAQDGARRAFSSRYGTDEFPNCSEGGIVPWVVLGADWAAVFPTQDVAAEAAEGLGGHLLTEFEGEGPPISYLYPYCPHG